MALDDDSEESSGPLLERIGSEVIDLDALGRAALEARTLRIGWGASQCGFCRAEVAIANVCTPTGRDPQASCRTVFTHVGAAVYDGCDSYGIERIAERFQLVPILPVDEGGRFGNAPVKTDSEMEVWMGKSIVGKAARRRNDSGPAVLWVTPFMRRCGVCGRPVQTAVVCTPVGLSRGNSCGAVYTHAASGGHGEIGERIAGSVAERLGIDHMDAAEAKVVSARKPVVLS